VITRDIAQFKYGL